MAQKAFLAPALATCASVLMGCGPAAETVGSSTFADDESGTVSNEASVTEPELVTSGECPGQAPTSTDGISGEDAGTENGDTLCPEHASTDACCCFDDDYPSATVVCRRTDLCQEIVVQSQRPAKEQKTTACPEAIDCALTALIEDRAGTIRWAIPSQWGKEIAELHIVGDGTAFISYLFEEDLGCIGKPVERKTLKTSAYFSACAMQASALERFECVREPVFGGPLEVCDAKAVCGGF